MTDQTADAEDQTDGPILAEGIDDEPVETNRRLFTGKPFLIVAILSTFYAAFHMAALNGMSISGMTGIERSEEVV